jgi:hypothetical protein
MTRTLVDACTDAKKCEYKCDEGYHRDGNKCVSNYATGSCGTLPTSIQNATGLVYTYLLTWANDNYYPILNNGTRSNT